MFKWLTNDFQTRVAAPAEAVLKQAGFTLAEKHVSNSFDNGWAIFRSDKLHITITRDRGSIEVLFRPPDSEEVFDFEALRRVIDGQVTYRQGLAKYGNRSSLPENYPELLALLEAYIPKAAAALDSVQLPQTREAIATILKDRVAFNFPGWSQP